MKPSMKPSMKPPMRQFTYFKGIISPNGNSDGNGSIYITQVDQQRGLKGSAGNFFLILTVRKDIVRHQQV